MHAGRIFAGVCTLLLVYGQNFDYDVYNGRHFNTLVLDSTTNDNVVVTPALLIMYAPACKLYVTLNEIRQYFPSEQYLVMVGHDYISFRRDTWYEIDDVDDLYGRYMTSPNGNCQQMLFFPLGSRVNSPHVWDYQGSLIDWVWAYFTHDVQIVNLLDTTITVDIWSLNDDDEDYTDTVEAESTASFATALPAAIFIHTGDIDDVLLKQTLLPNSYNVPNIVVHHEMLSTKPNWPDEKVQYCDSQNAFCTDDYFLNIASDTNMTSCHLENEPSGDDSEDWFHEQFHAIRGAAEKAKQWQVNVAAAAMDILRQPIHLPRYTKAGFHKMKIPTELYDKLTSFYFSHDRHFEANDIEPYVNTGKVQTSFVALDSDPSLVDFAVDILQPVAEESSGVSLEFVVFYGIREYYTGNRLLMHVDIPETHVISAILMIHQVTNASDPWYLQVIDFEGKRRNISMDDGDMLLYESATLVHGRPMPFSGKIFANCYIHFKPAEGWDF